MPELTVEGLEDVERGLGELRRILLPEGMRRTLKGVGMIAERRILSSFRKETAPQHVAPVVRAQQAAGRPWKPLAASTLAARRKRGRGAKILQDTGAGAASVGMNVGTDQVEIGIGLEYMGYQHGGTDPYDIYPRTKQALRFIGADGQWVTRSHVHHPGLDPRPMVGVDDQDIDGMGLFVIGQMREAVS